MTFIIIVIPAVDFNSSLQNSSVILSKEDVQQYVLLSGETENDGLICEFKDGLHLFFFYKQSIFDPRPENCLSFSKKSPQKLFSNCLVDGLLTSIV